MVDFRNMFTIHRNLLSLSLSHTCTLSLFLSTQTYVTNHYFFFFSRPHLFFSPFFPFYLDTAETVVRFRDDS